MVGDLSTNHGYYLDYERIVVKFRGSTIFHDYDLAGKTPQGLISKPYQTFDKKALLERQELYEEMAKKIWNVNRLDEQLN